MTKILMLLQAPFPPDIRLEKEIKSLSEAEYNVVLLCNQYDKSKEPQFLFGKIVRIKALFKNTKLNKIINFPVFFNPRLIYYLFKTFVKEKPDFIHAHDLPTVPLALILKIFFGKKVIFDMHENYPQALREFKKKGILNYLFKNAYLAEKLENFCIKRIDKIIVVVEENKVRLTKNNIQAENIHVISNTVDLGTFRINNKINTLSYLDGKYIIFYSGTVSPERGLHTAVLAMKFIKEKLPNAFLLIIGEGKSVNYLKGLVIKNNLENYVNILKWCGHEILPSYISRADICIIPQPNNDFINTTIPHKLFEYMLMEKPVLVSDAIPLKRIIYESQAGLVFKSENPEDFALKVIEMHESQINFGINGRIAVEKKYNWNYDANELIKLYNSLLN